MYIYKNICKYSDLSVTYVRRNTNTDILFMLWVFLIEKPDTIIFLIISLNSHRTLNERKEKENSE